MRYLIIFLILCSSTLSATFEQFEKDLNSGKLDKYLEKESNDKNHLNDGPKVISRNKSVNYYLKNNWQLLSERASGYRTIFILKKNNNILWCVLGKNLEKPKTICIEP